MKSEHHEKLDHFKSNPVRKGLMGKIKDYDWTLVAVCIPVCHKVLEDRNAMDSSGQTRSPVYHVKSPEFPRFDMKSTEYP